MSRPNKIWFRKDTRWWMVTIAGKKIRLAKGRKNKRAAEQKFHELMIARHHSPDAGDARVADLIEEFLGFAEKRYAADTNRNYRFYGQKFAEACGQHLAGELKPFHVTQWVDQHPWNETTERNARRVAHRIMTWTGGLSNHSLCVLVVQEVHLLPALRRAGNHDRIWKRC